MSYISAITRGDDVIVWERDETGRHEVTYTAPFYFYAQDERGKHRTIYGQTCSKVECATRADFNYKRKKYQESGLPIYESDVEPELRVLSNSYYNKPAPKLHIGFYDIEVDYDPDRGFPNVENAYAPINSISLFHEWSKELFVFAVPPEEGWTDDRLREEVNQCVPEAPIPADYKVTYNVCQNERELLALFVDAIEDCDVICGWNSDLFDTPYVGKRLEKHFGKKGLAKLDFEGGRPNFRDVISRVLRNPDGTPKKIGVTIDLDGRLAADYMNLYKKYEPGEKASFKLASIEQEVGLNLPKLEYQGTLHDLYRTNFAFFIRYNIRDTEILNGFEQVLGYVELANQMYHISTGHFKHVTGTIRLVELSIINYCHHVRKLVVPSGETPDEDRQIDGALVLLPQISLQEWTGSIDINSLYPTAIRLINISPETLVGQFVEYSNAVDLIQEKSKEELTLELENGTVIIKTAAEFGEFLTSKKWAISGYGTVFDQNEIGIIPAILAEWYKQRKEYQHFKKQAEAAGDKEKAAYYDRLQYVYKIKLNSTYGALTNFNFKFFDLRMGESTTATGRRILKHQCRKVAEILDGDYNVEFPLYESVPEAEDAGLSAKFALNGPLFNGTFMSESVIYGDTDSTYFKTHATNKEDAIKIADAVAARVNASYKGFVQQTFLVHPGFDDLVKAGREIVTDRGIFVNKKRYILHVVDKEGKASDSMKVMGLDTKKTTLPRHVGDKLNGFIERYLKGSSWEQIAQDIVAYKDELRTTADPMLIGLPKGVQKIEEYTEEYKRVGESARLPGHVAAAIHYNLCLKQFGDKESVPIMSGMKLKVFYLTKTFGKFKSIALPTDIEVIPAWFAENFEIDLDAHIERLVDNPLENILRAIGKRTPTRHDLAIEDAFGF